MRRKDRTPETIDSPSSSDYRRVLEAHFPNRADGTDKQLIADVEGTYRNIRMTLGETLVEQDDRNPELLDRIALDISATICEAFQKGVEAGIETKKTPTVFQSILNQSLDLL